MHAHVLKDYSGKEKSLLLISVSYPLSSSPRRQLLCLVKCKNLVSIFHAEMLNSLTFIECLLCVRAIQGAVGSTKDELTV